MEDALSGRSHCGQAVLQETSWPIECTGGPETADDPDDSDD